MTFRSMATEHSRTISVTDGQALVWAISLGLIALALLLRVGLLSAPAEFDELYHLLAARGWLETGRPTILDGEYTRGGAYTQAVAELFRFTHSQSLATGRLVSVLPGVLLPVAVFLWLRRVVETPVAVLGGLFVVFWPIGIIESQLLRFYSWHVLLFVSGAIAVYLATIARTRAGLFWLVPAAVLWACAMALQVTTAIGIVGVLAWAFFVVFFRVIRTPRGRLIGLGLVIALGVAVCLVAVSTGIAAKAWRLYRWTPLHAAEFRDYYGFYFSTTRHFYGHLWHATPILAALALWVRPRLTSFCLTVFLVAFLVHSFGGMKAIRYMSYAMPFLFAIWAIGLATVVAWGGAAIRRILPASGRWAGFAVAVVLGLAVVSTSTFVPRALMLSQGESLPERDVWGAVPEAVGDWTDAPFVATIMELHTLLHFGPYDLLISPSRLSELPPEEEFKIDFRTGRPVIGYYDGVAAMLNCRRDGLLLTTEDWWFNDFLGRAMEELLVEMDFDYEVRTSGPITAVRWYGDGGRPDCSEAPAIMPE